MSHKTMTGMKCIEQFSWREHAMPSVKALRDAGIAAKLVVDPLESMAPALSSFRGVGLMVPEGEVSRALAILKSGDTHTSPAVALAS